MSDKRPISVGLLIFEKPFPLFNAYSKLFFLAVSRHHTVAMLSSPNNEISSSTYVRMPDTITYRFCYAIELLVIQFSDALY